ncbi:type 1 glutamine amidotransferase [Phreatobacter oligotrophus]|jgi:GMP synthase (glutamine-hydrolysing)|uniref:GMP synthase (Glutamine-hydrolysing) n=1 Tax=Phreatobacter oligotrophus TaxID=1122261 RepID=A0A2T4YXL0_9HYPH|nr:type 1 glutamine amidotransferase [Phreatobacter oligotrophus]MBX9991967.1 type 1 glutamine amidotransferase [Phreatobacter oligotrophus]PTM50865.1 GMP synthase (glutamine-hydrolysing) [Phreatobacter oligotrophus]
MSLRLLVVEGNTAADRARHAASRGATPSEAYAEVLRELAPDAVCDIAFPADPGANLPDAGGLEGYDGVALTGSSLNLYDMTPEIRSQIDLARQIFASGTPVFGSCWGLQVLTTAAGGVVRRNPKGREMGFARKIVPNEAGRAHPMLAGRPIAFDAPAVHQDEVETMAPGTTLLASNGMSEVQAVEIRVGEGLAWAVQYHPEFSLAEVAAIGGALGPRLVDEGFFEDMEALSRWRADLEALDADPSHQPAAWRHGFDEQLLDTSRRRTEIANWLATVVRPAKSRRGRA